MIAWSKMAGNLSIQDSHSVNDVAFISDIVINDSSASYMDVSCTKLRVTVSAKLILAFFLANFPQSLPPNIFVQKIFA